MTPEKFKAIRQKIGLTQARLAYVLDYQAAIRISEIECGRAPIGKRIAMLMYAFESGWRPPIGLWKPIT